MGRDFKIAKMLITVVVALGFWLLTKDHSLVQTVGIKLCLCKGIVLMVAAELLFYLHSFFQFEQLEWSHILVNYFAHVWSYFCTDSARLCLDRCVIVLYYMIVEKKPVKQTPLKRNVTANLSLKRFQIRDSSQQNVVVQSCMNSYICTSTCTVQYKKLCIYITKWGHLTSSTLYRITWYSTLVLLDYVGTSWVQLTFL